MRRRLPVEGKRLNKPPGDNIKICGIPQIHPPTPPSGRRQLSLNQWGIVGRRLDPSTGGHFESGFHCLFETSRQTLEDIAVCVMEMESPSTGLYTKRYFYALCSAFSCF